MTAALDSTTVPPKVPGWRVIVSDQGRLWASRVEPFTPAQARAGAFRTVDADDPETLRAEIDIQERIAESAT